MTVLQKPYGKCYDLNKWHMTFEIVIRVKAIRHPSLA